MSKVERALALLKSGKERVHQYHTLLVNGIWGIILAPTSEAFLLIL